MGRVRRTTLQDIASVLGLSINTVSRALAGKSDIGAATAERVAREAKRQGYVPNSMARSLVLGSAMTIGVVITNPSNPFYARMISAIERRCKVAGYSLLLMVSEENIDNERRAIDTMLRWGVDGAVVVPVQTEVAHWKRLADARVPVVLVNRSVTEFGWDMIGIDYETAASAAAIHLSSQGVSHLYLLEEDLEISTVMARIDGFVTAAAKADAPAEVVRVPTRRDGSSTLPWEPVEAYAIARRVMASMSGRSGIVVGNDYFALGVYKAAAEAGFSIPRDILVAGFGDHPFSAYLSPGLTSVRLPAEEVGAAAVDQLLRRLDESTTTAPAVLTQLRSELMVRGSSVSDFVAPVAARQD